MYTLFVILIVLAAVLMIGIVLIQESKGGGLASNFSSSNQIMGVRKTTDFIEKATWGLAATMVVVSVICAHVAPQSNTEQSVMERNADTTPVNPQAFGAAQSQKGGEQGAAKQADAKQGDAKQGEAAQQGAAQQAPAQQQGEAAAPAANAEGEGK